MHWRYHALMLEGFGGLAQDVRKLLSAHVYII